MAKTLSQFIEGLSSIAITPTDGKIASYKENLKSIKLNPNFDAFTLKNLYESLSKYLISLFDPEGIILPENQLLSRRTLLTYDPVNNVINIACMPIVVINGHSSIPIHKRLSTTNLKVGSSAYANLIHSLKENMINKHSSILSEYFPTSTTKISMLTGQDSNTIQSIYQEANSTTTGGAQAKRQFLTDALQNNFAFSTLEAKSVIEEGSLSNTSFRRAIDCMFILTTSISADSFGNLKENYKQYLDSRKKYLNLLIKEGTNLDIKIMSNEDLKKTKSKLNSSRSKLAALKTGIEDAKFKFIDTLAVLRSNNIRQFYDTGTIRELRDAVSNSSIKNLINTKETDEALLTTVKEDLKKDNKLGIANADLDYFIKLMDENQSAKNLALDILGEKAECSPIGQHNTSFEGMFMPDSGSVSSNTTYTIFNDTIIAPYMYRDGLDNLRIRSSILNLPPPLIRGSNSLKALKTILSGFANRCTWDIHGYLTQYNGSSDLTPLLNLIQEQYMIYVNASARQNATRVFDPTWFTSSSAGSMSEPRGYTTTINDIAD